MNEIVVSYFTPQGQWFALRGQPIEGEKSSGYTEGR